MKGLESVVLPLEQSRALAEKVKLDTALVWVYVKDANGKIVLTVMPSEDAAADCLGADCDGQKVICGAPVLSELLDAIRARVAKRTDETTIALMRDAGASCMGIRVEGVRKYHAAPAASSTDLLAAAALLREVSR